MHNIKIEHILKHVPNAIDLFICCASFEDRFLSIPKKLAELNIKDTLAFQVKEYKEYSDDNLEEFKKILPKHLINEVSLSDPIVTADSLVASIGKIQFKKTCVIDISTFPREILLILLQYIDTFKSKFGDIIIVYTDALSMSKWLSSGVKEVRPIIGYAGDFVPSKELHLSIILGFEVERARAVINALEPSIISIGYGSENESINDELATRNKNFMEELESFCDSPRVFNMNLFDINQGKKDIENHLREFRNYNNVILPLNTKISTIAIGMLANENKSLQLCYTEMLEYNTADYSEPSDECRVIPLEY